MIAGTSLPYLRPAHAEVRLEAVLDELGRAVELAHFLDVQLVAQLGPEPLERLGLRRRPDADRIARSGWRTLGPALPRAARATLTASRRNAVSASSRSSIRAGSATGQLARWTLSGAPGSRPATRFR